MSTPFDRPMAAEYAEPDAAVSPQAGDEERVVESASKLDLAMIFGTGFPPFRGGLLRHADALGAPAAVAALEDLARRVGARFEPAPLLREMAASGARFHADALNASD